MPYIKQEDRQQYEFLIADTVDKVMTLDGKNIKVGDLNYLFSSIIWTLFDKNPCYKNASALRGVLADVDAEFLRRRVNPYEERKIAENGDICK